LAKVLINFAGQPPNCKKWVNILTQQGFRLTYPNEQNHEAVLLTSIEDINFGKYYERLIQVNFGGLALRVLKLQDLIA
jgi:ssDNA-specific exonuclease RecJ